MPDDPFIRELLPEFVDTWISDVDAQYDLYLEQKNSTELYRLAHTLKGSCFQFGLDDIANMGIELMGYCKAEDWQNATRMGPIIKQSFAEAKAFLINEGLA